MKHSDLLEFQAQLDEQRRRLEQQDTQLTELEYRTGHVWWNLLTVVWRGHLWSERGRAVIFAFARWCRLNGTRVVVIGGGSLLGFVTLLVALEANLLFREQNRKLEWQNLLVAVQGFLLEAERRAELLSGIDGLAAQFDREFPPGHQPTSCDFGDGDSPRERPCEVPQDNAIAAGQRWPSVRLAQDIVSLSWAMQPYHTLVPDALVRTNGMEVRASEGELGVSTQSVPPKGNALAELGGGGWHVLGSLPGDLLAALRRLREVFSSHRGGAPPLSELLDPAMSPERGQLVVRVVSLRIDPKSIISLKGQRAWLVGADLSEAALEWTNLSWANLSDANLSQASLSRATLIGTNLSGADLSKADLRNVVLSQAVLKHADLSLATLDESFMNAAVLTGATFAEAKMNGTFLGDATLSYADFREVDLSRVRGVSREQLLEACLDSATTQLPPSLNFDWASYHLPEQCSRLEDDRAALAGGRAGG